MWVTSMMLWYTLVPLPHSLIMRFTAGCEEQQDELLIASASKVGRDDVSPCKCLQVCPGLFQKMCFPHLGNEL